VSYKRLSALQKITDIDSDSSMDMECTPPKVLEVAKNNSLNLLPPKSRPGTGTSCPTNNLWMGETKKE
jgi:hypothetical protein